MTIQARLGSGIRDYLPTDMIPRQAMLDKIRKSFEAFGFVPLDTPALEVEEVLTGGDPNFRMHIYRAGLRDSEGEETLGLRFDLTVPLARVVAQYGDKIPRPFKRYQSGKVWRGEKAQAGRFREFVQFDADIVGSNRPSADAEIISLMYETMRSLGFNDFLIRVNNRKVLNGLAKFAGFDPSITPKVLRSMDKLDKIEWKGVSDELRSDSNLSNAELSKLKEFLDLMSESGGDILVRLESLMTDSDIAMEGVNELKEVMTLVRALGVPSDKCQIDLSVARGLGYYTGTVFETILTNLPQIGSVFSGGRYDDLVERFGSNSLPAVGASVGVDRLFAAMERLGLVESAKSLTEVMILNFDKESEEIVSRCASDLRRNGIVAEIYLGKETTIKGQLSYAVKQDCPLVVIVGATERESNSVMLKNTRTRDQVAISTDSLVERVKESLKV